MGLSGVPIAVDVWQFALSEFSIPADDDPRPLSVDERDHAIQLSPQAAKRFGARRTGLRFALATYANQRPGDLVFTRGCLICGHPRHGKPRLVEHEAVRFSAASAGDLMMVAVSRKVNVGVDVERLVSGTASELDGMAAVAFDAHERVRLGLRVGALTAEDFTRGFVAKEALGKAVGTGLSESVASLSSRWQLHEINVPIPYRACLATDSDGHKGSIEIHRLTSTHLVDSPANRGRLISPSVQSVR